MPDNNQIAKELARLGHSDLKHLRALERNRAARCALLCEVAESGQAGLSPATFETAVAPKDD
jgi:hypothetical protein